MASLDVVAKIAVVLGVDSVALLERKSPLKKWSMHPVLTLLGRNVRRIRRARDMSEDELARRATLTRAYVRGLEQGARNPTADTLFRLARALGVAPADLFARRLAASRRE